MMIRALDANGDWTFGTGSQNYLTGQAAINQDLVCRLKLWKGECFFALTEGVDYNNLMDFGTKHLLDSNIRQVILQTSGVIRIDKYTSIITNRALSVTASVVTVYRTLTFQEAI